jgi:hypothetical protein
LKNKGSPGVCRDFMENVVRHDDLWTSLQVNLWNTQRSDSPTPDKLRVFEDCCTVLDLTFTVLEDSREVDWRAPEFGSLAQHFEGFITHFFKDTFMGRATSFRIGIIRARICKALLTQFWNDNEREGTVSFRSQWDVAFLARLIQSLGIRDKEDVEFWNSYINGGHIGATFTAKALEMIDRTARDGTILILCKLGQLVAAAVPLDQSGLGHKDIDKVWELQRRLKEVVEEKQLPLHRASGTVWEVLRQLQDQVNDLCGKNTGSDRVILRRLLRMIKDVYGLRSSGSGHPGQSGPVEEQNSRTPVALDLMSPPGELPGVSNVASESTAVAGGPPGGTQAREGENECESSLFNS